LRFCAASCALSNCLDRTAVAVDVAGRFAGDFAATAGYRLHRLGWPDIKVRQGRQSLGKLTHYGMGVTVHRQCDRRVSGEGLGKLWMHPASG